MSTWTYHQSDSKAASKIVPPRLRIPCWKGLGADSEEKREPASDIDTVVVHSLKALEAKWPIREVDVAFGREVALAPARVLLRPGILEAPVGRGRKAAGVLAEQRDKCLLELSGGDALR